MSLELGRGPVALAVATMFAAAATGPGSANAGRTGGNYVAGDFHNHTTCSDGSISMQKLVKKATDKADATLGPGLVRAGRPRRQRQPQLHAGRRRDASPRRPTRSSRAHAVRRAHHQQSVASQFTGPQTTWARASATPTSRAACRVRGTSQNMWRWQSLQEFQYPLMEYLSAYQDMPLFLGVESVVAGHEHTSMSVITGQMPAALDDVSAAHRRPATRALGNANGAGPVAILLRPRRHRHQPRQHHGHQRHRQQLGLLRFHRQPERSRRDAELERRPRPEADPSRRHRHRHTRPRQDARGGQVDGATTIPTAATTCPRTSSAPARSTRTATTASTSSTCATSTTRHRRSRSASRRSRAMAPRRSAASTSRRATTSAACWSTRWAAPPTAAPASTARRSAACGTRCSAKAATGGSSPAPTGTTAAASVPTTAARRRTSSRASTSATTRWCATAAIQAASAGDRRRPAHRQQLRRLGGQLIDRLAFVACAVPPEAAAHTGKGLEALAQAAVETLALVTALKNTDERPARLRDDGREAGRAPGLRHRRGDRRARPGGHELLALHASTTRRWRRSASSSR